MLLKLKHEQQSSFVDNLISERGERGVKMNSSCYTKLTWCERDDYNDDGA